MGSKKSFSPFNKEELLPQEEKLAVMDKSNKLKVGILKETDKNENRTPLSQLGVKLLIDNGISVYIEKGAVAKASFNDLMYSEVGADIKETKEEVFEADIILKISSFTEKEISLLKKQHIIISAINLNTLSKEYISSLMNKRLTAIGMELIKDDTNCYPIIKSMGEIAGSTSILIAAEYLSSINQGKGEMLGGIPGIKPTDIVILGAGTVGITAAKTALGLGASVKVFDNSVSRLRKLHEIVGQNVSTSFLQQELIHNSLLSADVVIGALNKNHKSNFMVREETIKQMKNNSVLIDISIDSGGVFETSRLTNHQKPTFVKHGVIHYCVPNIPSKVARTASYAISNILSGLIIEITDGQNFASFLRSNFGIRRGTYIYNGILTNHYIASKLDLPNKDIDLIMAAF
jgi:alanine dehydrogenase